jgi:hypothetical protein
VTATTLPVPDLDPGIGKDKTHLFFPGHLLFQVFPKIGRPRSSFFRRAHKTPLSKPNYGGLSGQGRIRKIQRGISFFWKSLYNTGSS